MNTNTDGVSAMSTALPMVCQHCKRPIGGAATYIGTWPYHYECTRGPAAPLTEADVRRIVREELRRLAAVEASQSELLEALQNLIEAAESMKGTYTFVQGKTPDHEDQYGHEKWAEEFLQETTDAARTAIAKATGETR